ncbi:hypothetical protein DPEC_G00242700 [Dallia pectoralis]|uniref:Uncharacterized protein n=1 Tax=Dallia pectoralis TaxID=75939 RepID=A0ACC2FV80_DALPE|nr:hypothetical protein DPEC_G00242700 [Dallia pectoralis]
MKEAGEHADEEGLREDRQRSSLRRDARELISVAHMAIRGPLSRSKVRSGEQHVWTGRALRGTSGEVSCPEDVPEVRGQANDLS